MKGNFAGLARDHNIPLAALESFAQGIGSLPEETLHKLTQEFFMNARFNPETNLLEDTRPPPAAFPVHCVPEPWTNPDPAIARAQAAYKVALEAARPKPPPKPVKLEPKRLMPGWANRYAP
jgi:hypothetical protein